MTRIVAISGSLRNDSFNTALLRAAAQNAPEGVLVDVATLHGIPLYDGDLEDREGLPKAVRQLKDLVNGADGVIIATPEYNHSFPGVLKNALDWMSRPPTGDARVFSGKPVALTGASTGPVGTRMAQAALLPTLRALGTIPWFGRLLFVSNAAQCFDADGNLIDEKMKSRLAEFIRDFADFTK